MNTKDKENFGNQALTTFMEGFWNDVGWMTEEKYKVPDFPSKTVAGTAIYIPDGLSMAHLGRLFPKMNITETGIGTSIHNSGWYEVETSDQKPDGEGWEPISVLHYVVWGQVRKLLNGLYPDEGVTHSRCAAGQGVSYLCKFRHDGSFLKFSDLGTENPVIKKLWERKIE